MADPGLLRLKPAPIAPLPRGRLLDNIPVIPPTDIIGDNVSQSSRGVRWINGITWNPLPSRPFLTHSTDICVQADFTDPNYQCVAAVTQKAFIVYDAIIGSAIEWEPGDLNDILEERVPYMMSASFATELITGAASGSGFSLSSKAHSPSGNGFGSPATPIWNAIAVLESELALTMFGGQGTIHMPPSFLGEAVTRAGVRFIDGQYQTTTGHLVIADAGYTAAAAPTGQAAAGVAQDWIYASGPVRYAIADDDEGFDDMANISTFMDFTKNRYRRWESTYGILQFSPAFVTAVLTSYAEED